MASVMSLRLVLWIATVIRLTSSQATYDVTHHGSDAHSCDRSEQAMSQLLEAVSQLQRDVAELKTGNQQQAVTGRPLARFKCIILVHSSLCDFVYTCI